MDNDDYRQNMDTLIMATRSFLLLASTVSTAELQEMRRTVEMAEGVGHFIDPTAWREASASGSLERQKAMIEAHQAFRAVMAKHFQLLPAGIA